MFAKFLLALIVSCLVSIFVYLLKGIHTAICCVAKRLGDIRSIIQRILVLNDNEEQQ